MATISSDGFSWNFHTVSQSPPAKPAAAVTNPIELKTRQAAWQKIDEKLLEWRRDPSQLDDDGVTPPTTAVIEAACNWANARRSEQPPTRVCPTGDGGIAFELRTPGRSESIEFTPDDEVYYTAFVDGELITHERIR